MRAGRALLPLLSCLLLSPAPAIAGPFEELGAFAGALASLRRVSIASLRLASPGEPGVTVTDLVLDLPADAGAGYRLRAARLTDNARPPRFAPAGLAASATPAAGALRLSGTVEIAAAPLRIALDGEWDPAGGAGVLRIDAGRIAFAAGGLQPALLSPALGDLLRKVEGEIGFLARIEWGPRSRQLAELSLDDLSMELAGVPVSGVRGRIAFDALVPPATLPGQEITVARIGGGPALERGRILFTLAAGRELAVQRLEFAVAGGRLSARPFTLALDRPAASVTVELRGLRLERLLAESGLPGLSGEGIMDGRLVARIAADRVTIEEGRLAARGPGTLRYAPEEPPPVTDPRMVMLLQAIRNFHFTRLEASVEGDLLDELRLTIGLGGSNPDFYEGYPVALNVTFEGPLGTLLGAGIRAYRLPAEIERRLQRQTR